MATTPSPLRARRVPKSVSVPTEAAAAAATLAEAVVAPTAKRAAKKTKPAPAPAAEAAPKAAKVPKPKLVRDSFTMPKDEYQALAVLKARALALQRPVRKSELLRAGIQALSAMSDRAFLKAVEGVPTLKTGRPKGE